MKIDFTGQTAIVTGASRGIGKKIANDRDSLGANVIKFSSKDFNFLERDAVNELAEEIKKYDKIDICINNAGINKIDYVENIELSDFEDILNVNLYAPFVIAKAASGIMKNNNYGKIINIGSIWGIKTREKRLSYSTSKAGLIGMTRTLSVELAQNNILVNMVSPGFTATEMTKNILKKDEIDSLTSQIPLKRFANVGDISNVVLFLASNLNTYITGENIVVDGGFINQ